VHDSHEMSTQGAHLVAVAHLGGTGRQQRRCAGRQQRGCTGSVGRGQVRLHLRGVLLRRIARKEPTPLEETFCH
jgi:hypothetical protein